MARLTKWNGKKWILPQGMWREIADRLAAYENTGMEPEEIAALQARSAAEQTAPAGGGIITAVFIRRNGGGYVPHIDPTTGTARLFISEVEELADNPEVLREIGANHLVIESNPDFWHIAQVSGYTPDTGLHTKLY